MALDRLSPTAESIQDSQPKLAPSTDLWPERQHLRMEKTGSQSKGLQSEIECGQRDLPPKQPQSQFKMNDRVVVHNKQGLGIHGTVKWIEKVNYEGEKLIAVGIETVRYCTQSKTCI